MPLQTEYEATFERIAKDDMRERLRLSGATCVREEFLQKRIALHLPDGHEKPGEWLRVRDEGDKITMSFKYIPPENSRIDQQKEVCLQVDNFEQARLLLESIGCRVKAFQESKREIWTLGNVEIVIDEWPFLEPYLEIEGSNEADVRDVAEKLGFMWDQALFCGVGVLYARQYDMPARVLNDETPLLTFDMENPFIQ